MFVLTFDIEDWFHVLDNEQTRNEEQWLNLPRKVERGVEMILDCLDRQSVRGTFFILGWVAREHPDLVREIARRGHDIGCHSYAHQLVYEQSPAEFEADLARALDEIQACTGEQCISYRAPGFSIKRANTWAFEILDKHGIENDSSLFLGPRAHGGFDGLDCDGPFNLLLPSDNVVAMWPLVGKSVLGRNVILSGGGYFRLAPYWMLRRLFSASDYQMTYFHPRDFDARVDDVPGVSRFRQWKLSVGSGTALAKLEALLSEYKFVSLPEAKESLVKRRTIKLDEL